MLSMSKISALVVVSLDLIVVVACCVVSFVESAALWCVEKRS
jgi:hypothetical protein